MKIIGRTLIILAVALVVVGAAIGFSRSGIAAQLIPGGRGDAFTGRGLPGDDNQVFPGGAFDGQRPPEGFNRGEFSRGGERHGDRSGALGIFSFLSLGRYLLTISVIVVVVVLIDRLFSRWKRRQKVAE
ncbi:MAG: hypothetical protein H6667_25710 [Ardenticatenaceae bacterium]|nr:hypothetical protein [Ardenticatenaceae bacterium]